MEKKYFSGLIMKYVNELDNEMLKFIDANELDVKMPSIYDFLIQNI